jgi:large subunit ribosomal protein L15
MQLNTINTGPKRKTKRVGRGIGSTKGKTSGRGHKGQKSRSGVAIKSFEGGQMPLYRRLPKRGFSSIHNKKNLATINLEKIQALIDNKKIIPSKKITLSELQKMDLVNKKYKKIKILGKGDIKTKFDADVNFISKPAKEKIEKLGGKVTLIK